MLQRGTFSNALLAVSVLVGLVIPLPVVVLVLTKGLWRVDPQYVNTLINGLRPHCRWWWSVDMLRRVVLMATYSFIPHWFTKQVSKLIKISHLQLTYEGSSCDHNYVIFASFRVSTQNFHLQSWSE